MINNAQELLDLFDAYNVYGLVDEFFDNSPAQTTGTFWIDRTPPGANPAGTADETYELGITSTPSWLSTNLRIQHIRNTNSTQHIPLELGSIPLGLSQHLGIQTAWGKTMGLNLSPYRKLDILLSQDNVQLLSQEEKDYETLTTILITVNMRQVVNHHGYITFGCTLRDFPREAPPQTLAFPFSIEQLRTCIQTLNDSVETLWKQLNAELT